MIMLGIFAAWAIPYLQITAGMSVAHAWSRQFSGRLLGEDFKLLGWIWNIPRGLGYFLPWILILPFPRAEFVDESDRRLARGLGWGIAGSFLALSLIPGSLPRYTMPLIAPMCWLTASLLCAERLDMPRWLEWRIPAFVRPKLRLPFVVALLAVGSLAVYAVVVMPQLQLRQKVKTLAAQIEQNVPAGETVFAVNPDFQPFLFYVHRPLLYVDRIDELPFRTNFFLVRSGKENDAMSTKQFLPRHAVPVLRIRDYRNWETILFRVTL
jgi:hypothetical protein